MSDTRLEELRQRLGEIADVRAAIALLHWDEETYMPPKAAPARAQQLATLSALAHRMFTDPELGKLLEELSDTGHAVDPADGKLVEVTRYDYNRATKLPDSFVHEFALVRSRAFETWLKARKESDFQVFRPHLERLVELLRQKASLLGYEGSPYNALLEGYERGMTTERLREIFAELAPRQSDLVARIVDSPHQVEVVALEGPWEEEGKWAFTLDILRDMGYDFGAGRQDKSVHPFSTSFDLHDVRVTTRFSPDSLFMGLMGSIHEGGHALYSQGHDPADRRTPLLDGPSLGMHESQSRLWENIIGRSLPFWRHYLPRLRKYFPGRLDGVAPEYFYRAINRVQPSLIRTEADECTYNLHIILRFELEVDLIEGTVSVADIPELWNAKVKEYLGIDVPDDAHGCLQDIHWSHGEMGYFPTYALGNLYAAQIFDKILEDIPQLWEQVESGRFADLLGWLREHIHRHGRRKLAHEIIRDITGRPPHSEPYLRYLEQKYSQLYRL